MRLRVLGSRRGVKLRYRRMNYGLDAGWQPL